MSDPSFLIAQSVQCTSRVIGSVLLNLHQRNCIVRHQPCIRESVWSNQSYSCRGSTGFNPPGTQRTVAFLAIEGRSAPGLETLTLDPGCESHTLHQKRIVSGSMHSSQSVKVGRQLSVGVRSLDWGAWSLDRRVRTSAVPPSAMRHTHNPRAGAI